MQVRLTWRVAVRALLVRSTCMGVVFVFSFLSLPLESADAAYRGKHKVRTVSLVPQPLPWRVVPAHSILQGHFAEFGQVLSR